MPITIQCPACLTIHTASDVVVGRRIRCPACNGLVDIADPDGSPSGFRQSEETMAGASETSLALPDADRAADDGGSLPEAGRAQPAPPPLASNSPADVLPDAGEQEPEPAFSRKPHLEDTELDMTPMVDVVFQLLIFFMLTAAFALQKSLTLPKVSDDQPSENVVAKSIESSPEYVIVQVDEFGTFHVITVDWDEEAPSDQDLHVKLRRAREGNVNGVIPSKLMVEAHGDALHGRVVAALDAGTATGFEEVQLTTVEEN